MKFYDHEYDFCHDVVCKIGDKILDFFRAILMKTKMRLRQCRPVGEAGTPLAETEAGTHSQVRAFQTASSGAQILQPMDDSILSCMTRRTDVLNAIFKTNLETMCPSNNLGII